VAPLATVSGLTWVLLKMPSLLSFLKKSMPGWMSVTEPPLATAAAQTALNAALALVGSPLSATLPLSLGLSSSLIVVGHGTLILAALQPIDFF